MSSPLKEFSSRAPVLTSCGGIGRRISQIISPEANEFDFRRVLRKTQASARCGAPMSADFDSTRYPFGYPGMSSNKTAGRPILRMAMSTIPPISLSRSAPLTVISSPASRMALIQDRRSWPRASVCSWAELQSVRNSFVDSSKNCQRQSTCEPLSPRCSEKAQRAHGCRTPDRTKNGSWHAGRSGAIEAGVLFCCILAEQGSS